MQITVADIQKISVKDGETLVVFIDINNMPRPRAEKIMQDAARFMRQAIPNTAVQIIVVPQTYSFGVIDPTQAAQVIGSAGGSGATPIDPTDPFDRAMKGLI